MTDTVTKAVRSRIMAAVRGKDTGPEMVVRRMVHGMGYRYRLHVRSLPGKPDLVFPRLRKIILVNGCFWHLHSCNRGGRRPQSHAAYWNAKLNRNRERDRLHRAALRRLGWKVLVVWECQTAAAKMGRLQSRLLRFLR
ncbi:MAG: DNA mismatch endonuclease Vsr [Pirellulales bacterium]|nr:DNA mismatch endonuclease Vsr [Pirellulales bacterium]